MADNKQWLIIKKQLEERFKDNKILILGFGREGMSTYHLLKKLSINYSLYIMDQNSAMVKSYLNNEGDATTHIVPTDHYLKELESYDLIFKTPGLPGFLLKDIKAEKILSQSEVFMEYLGAYSIGVTGTKGKSTTSSLIAHVLKALDLPVKLVGNIGYPAFECLETHTIGQWYVYEMSSFQTEFLHHGPRIRIVLNLFEEHLNNYEGYKAYQDAKLQLFFSDKAEDTDTNLCIYGADNTLLRERIEKIQWHDDKELETFGYMNNNVLNHQGSFLDDQTIIYQKASGEKIIYGDKNFSKELIGEHNLINSLVVINIVEYLKRTQILTEGIRPKQLLELIGNFKGLEHRLEKVGSYQGITFYNDSISTIPEAAIQAIYAVPNLMTLLIGGFDRGINYKEFTRQLLTFDHLHIICLPDTGTKIYQWASEMNPEQVRDYWHKAESIEEAVKMAYKMTNNGYSCLLSPAASSYNRYKNFEERGDHFKQSVRELK